MSLMPILWAMKNAPVVDAEERVILIAMAESAWSDGTDAFQSKKTLAETAVLDPKTVQRRLRTMEARGLIALGNQEAAAYIPEWFRPTVYDLLIPYSWYPDIEQVNAERQRRGKAPLTREDRPNLAPAPPKKQRADKGKARKRAKSVIHRGDYKAPPYELRRNRTGGGDYKTPRGGLQVREGGTARPPTLPLQPTPRHTPSFLVCRRVRQRVGRDGRHRGGGSESRC